MNNQPLPKPTQTTTPNKQDDNLVGTTPPPSSLTGVSDPVATSTDNQRIPLTQKPVTDELATNQTSSDSSNLDTFSKVIDKSKTQGELKITPKASDFSNENEVSGEIKLPPTSLSALSSMSSNSIPSGSEGKKKVVMPERTVLGRPIPQAIRGEKPPVFNTPIPQPTKNIQDKATSAPMPSIPGATKSPSTTTVEKTNNGGKPKFATEKKSIFKYLPLILGGVVILAIIGFIALKFFGNKTDDSVSKSPDTQSTSGEVAKRTEVPSKQTEIVYWGLWEPEEVVSELISTFEANNPGVKITYIKQSYKDYRERLQASFDMGKGPDVFRFHASWVPMLKQSLSPIPSSLISAKEFKENYYPIVSDQLVSGGQYLGVPLMYDGLALYYNEDILNSANEVPPKTWAELRTLASKLTVNSASGIERAGLAIGNTENVDHFPEILAVLMLQNKASFTEPNSQETRDAILFYTNFLSKDKVWSDSLPNSTVAFARGDVAMMFAPSWRAHEIIAQNPDLNFKITTLPQLSDERIAWGSYWAEGINSSSKNKDIAAKFVSFLSSDENLMKFYSKASEVRSFGEIYPKVSMAEKLINTDIVAPFIDDAPYAQSWYLNSFTHDNGINDQMIKYYKDGINAVLEGEDVEAVLETIDAGTKQVLKQYGVSSK